MKALITTGFHHSFHHSYECNQSHFISARASQSCDNPDHMPYHYLSPVNRHRRT